MSSDPTDLMDCLPAEFINEFFVSVNDLNQKRADNAVKGIREYLRKDIIRIYVSGNSPGIGHQASTIMAMERLIALGASHVEVLYEESAKERLQLLIPGFRIGMEKMQYREAQLDFMILDPQGTDRPAPRHMAVTCGLDACDDGILDVLNVTAFLQLQPFRWQKEDPRNYLWWRAGEQKHCRPLQAVEALGGKGFEELAISMPEPELDEDSWHALLEALPNSDGANLQKARLLVEGGRTKSFFFLPAQGVLLAEEGGPPSGVFNGNITVAMMLAAVKRSLSSKPGDCAVITLIGDQDAHSVKAELPKLYDYLVKALKVNPDVNSAISKKPNKEWYESYALLALEELARDDLLEFCIEKDVTELDRHLKNLGRGKILLTDLKQVPVPAFNVLMAHATLPFIFEGQGTANLAVNLGKPFIKLAKGYGDAVYHLPMMPDELGTIAADMKEVVQALLAVDLCEDLIGLRIGKVAGLMKKAIEPGTDIWKYCRTLQWFYRSDMYDKVTLALRYALAVVPCKEAPDQSCAARTGGLADDPLQALYTSMKAHLSLDTLTLYPGAIESGTQPIQAALAALPGRDKEFVITGATINFPAPHDVLTVEGRTTSLARLTLGVRATFTLDPDSQMLVMTLALKGRDLPLIGARWFSISEPTISTTVSNVGIRNYGAISGTVAIGGVALSIAADLPTENVSMFVVGIKDQVPSIEGIFQFIGGIDLASVLPRPLDDLAKLELHELAFAYDHKGKVLVAFSVKLRTTPDWNLLGQLTLKTIDFCFSVNDPVGARTVSWTARSRFALGPGVIEVLLNYPNPVITGAMASDSALIPIGELAAYFLGDEYSVPIKGNVTDLILAITPGANPTPTKYLVEVDVAGNWPVPTAEVPVFTVEQLGLHIEGSGSEATGVIRGAITFFEKDPNLAFGVLVSARYLGQGGWVIRGAQDNRKVEVGDILRHYLGEGWFVEALPNPKLSAFSAEIHVGGPVEYFAIGGTVELQVPFLSQTSISATGSFAKRIAGTSPTTSTEPVPSLPHATLKGKVTWYGVDLMIGVDYSPNDPITKQTYTLSWNGVTGAVRKQTVEGQEHWIGELLFDRDVTIGRIVEQFVAWVTGTEFGLAAPWNLLDDIALSGLKLKYDFTAEQVSFNVDVGPIELGFATIKQFGMKYDPAAEPKLTVVLEGHFLWTNDSKLSWDPSNPQSTMQPPGKGNEYLEVRLLAMGQRVEVTDPGDTVKEVIAALSKMPHSGGTSRPPVKYDPDSGWLIGADLGLLRYDSSNYAFTVQAVFNDPNLYALRILLAGPPAKILKGLDFAILYRKISDTVGVYKAEITLPEQIRTIQSGVFTIILPTFAIAVYTNGDFTVDVGFPWNHDFARSFQVQAIIAPGIPLLGAGGFYLSKLSSATTNKVPAASNGTFDPVIAFGFGAELGFGKTLVLGPLKASLSLTVLAIIEGVLARWNPYSPEDLRDSATQLDGNYYYSLSGLFGIAGTLNGYVDFAVVRASVNVSIIVAAQVTFASYAPIVFSVIAAVDVSASLTVDLGILSITIHFTFSLSLRASFTIPISDAKAPWKLDGAAGALTDGDSCKSLTGRLAAPVAHRLTALRRASGLLDDAAVQIELRAQDPAWSNLEPSSPVPLTGYVSFALTGAGDIADTLAEQLPCYVTMLVIDAPAPVNEFVPQGYALSGVADPNPDSSFEALAKLVARWVIAAFTAPMTSEKIDSYRVTADLLASIGDYLGNHENPQPVPLKAIADMLGGPVGAPQEGHVRLTLWGPDDRGLPPKVTGAVFPAIPELHLTVPSYDGSTALGYAFGGYNTLSSTALAVLRSYFDQLAVQVANNPETGDAAATTGRKAHDPAGGCAMAGLVFADYFLLIARRMIEALREGLRNFHYQPGATETPQGVVDWVNNQEAVTASSLGDPPPYTVADLFTANAELPVTPGTKLDIHGAHVTVSAGSSLASVAADLTYSNSFTAAELARVNAQSGTLLQHGATITCGEATTVVGRGDSLSTVADRLRVSLEQLIGDQKLLARADLLLPLATLAIPPYKYCTGESDTLATVAAATGITVIELASAPANTGIQGLFAATGEGGQPQLSLPHLYRMPVGVLLAEAQANGVLNHLAAAVSRYHMHGLRMPTVDPATAQPLITPNTHGMWVTEQQSGLTLPPEAGLYALTGQQFPIPPLGTDPLTVTVSNPDRCPWLSFANGTDSVTLTIKAGDQNHTAIKELRTWITTKRLVTNCEKFDKNTLLPAVPATYGLGPGTAWATATQLPLPYGDAPAGAAAQLRLLPATLTSLLNSSLHRTPPTFIPRICSYDEATGTTVSTGIGNYGWATTLPFTVKRVTQPPEGSIAGAMTYEIVGVDAAALPLLQSLVAEFPVEGSLFGTWVAYSPDPALRTNGLQTAAATFGIAQANLTTVTRPLQQLAQSATARSEAPAARGPQPLNGHGEFLRLLWEAAITASGGFYLYYAEGEGCQSSLPDHVFNADGQAVLTLIVVYGMKLANALAASTNAVVFTDPVPHAASVVVESVPITSTVTGVDVGSLCLSDLVSGWYADLVDLASENAETPLRSGTSLTITAGTYLVPPGARSSVGDLAARFGLTDPNKIIDLNPRISPTAWSSLPPMTAVRIPQVSVTVGTGPGGTSNGGPATLASIAAYHGADIVSVAYDNQDVRGLFAEPPVVRIGPFTRAAALPMGHQFLSIRRPVPVAHGPEGLLLNNFSLLGYRIGGNQDFHASNRGAPVGPTGAGGTGVGRRRVPRALRAGDVWTYEVTFGYLPTLARTMTGPVSPYAGVERLLQPQLEWLDLYGNTILSDLSDPQSGDSEHRGPVSGSPILLGYTDPLVALAQWPGVTTSWQVKGAQGLVVTFSMDTTRYTNDPKLNTGSVGNAQRDALVYQRLFDQITDPNGTAFTITTPLIENPKQITGENRKKLTLWVAAILEYVKGVADEQTPKLPDKSIELVFELPTEPPLKSEIAELFCTFTFARTGGLVQGDFAAVPGVREVSNELVPAGRTSLRDFATELEAAYSGKDWRVLVAHGPDVRSGASSRSLWLVTVAGEQSDRGIGFRVKGNPAVFAPAPVTTSLISRNAQITPYQPGKGLVQEEAVNRGFASVDLDQWVCTVLAAVEELLEPRYIAPLLILRHLATVHDLKMSDQLALLQAKKIALAKLYAQQMRPVFKDQATIRAEGVAEIFAQSMYQRLDNSYLVQAAMQFPIDVTASICEDVPTSQPPNVYGTVVQWCESGTALRTGLAFTPAKLPLRPGQAQLSFLVSDPTQPGGDTSNSQADVALRYEVADIEHQISKVPGIVGYEASTWLQFVNVPSAEQTADQTATAGVSVSLGRCRIPMALRSYPDTPTLILQQGTPTNPNVTIPDANCGSAESGTARLLGNRLADATQWTLTVTYSLPRHYAQDTVCLQTDFNVTKSPPTMESFEDSFAALAQFVAVYPDVQRDLNATLARITPTSGQSEAQSAATAITAVTNMLARIVSPVRAGQGLTIAPRPQSLVSATKDRFACRIREYADLAEKALVVSVMATSGPVPMVHIDGYTTVTSTANACGAGDNSNTRLYAFVDPAGKKLQYSAAASIGPRHIEYPGLKILQRQGSSTVCWVTRNEDLAQDRTTSDEFVYRTPEVSFSTPLRPTMSIGEVIDISEVSPDGSSVKRSLPDHLKALFDALVTREGGTTIDVQLVVTYHYTLNPTTIGMPLISVPVLMQPPLRVTTDMLQGQHAPAGATSLATMIDDLGEEITNWFGASPPSTAQGYLNFELIVTSIYEQQSMPILTLSNLVLKLADIDPPLVTAPRGVASRTVTSPKPGPQPAAQPPRPAT